jgi:hypothetical protein
MKKTYRGSCHCEAVRFEADIDLAEGTVKCNCSICSKQRNWLAAVKEGAFRLMAGESELAEYQFGARRLHHRFCKHCGVKVFSWGEPGGEKFYAVSVSALDDAPPEELATAPVMYVDGRNDDFKSVPKETRHL